MDEKDQSEVFSFVRDLVGATDGGDLQWESQDSSGTSFSLSTPTGIVYITSLGGSKGHPYVLTICDPDDRQIFEARSELGNWYNEQEELLALLFAAARRSVFDVTGTIQRMRNALNLP